MVQYPFTLQTERETCAAIVESEYCQVIGRKAWALIRDIRRVRDTHANWHETRESLTALKDDIYRGIVGLNDVVKEIDRAVADRQPAEVAVNDTRSGRIAARQA